MDDFNPGSVASFKSHLDASTLPNERKLNDSPIVRGNWKY